MFKWSQKHTLASRNIWHKAQGKQTQRSGFGTAEFSQILFAKMSLLIIFCKFFYQDSKMGSAATKDTQIAC